MLTQEEIPPALILSKNTAQGDSHWCPPSTTTGLAPPFGPQTLAGHNTTEADSKPLFVVPLRSSTRKDRNTFFLALRLKREMMCIQTDVGSDMLRVDRPKDSVVLKKGLQDGEPGFGRVTQLLKVSDRKCNRVV